MNDVMNLSFWQFLAGYLFVLLLIVIVKMKRISREKEIFLATIRMTLQLVLVGHVLVYVFENPHPLLTFAIIAIMQIFAINNIYKYAKVELELKMKRIIAFSMTVGIFSSLLFFIFVVLNVSPWYDPRYFIPIAGMVIGNSMTGISLGVNNLVNGIHSHKEKIEGALMLGAMPKVAAKEVMNQAFDAAMLPTIHSMAGMGIIFLPGMMTGQILSNISPVIAVKYQIAVMLCIVGSVSLSVLIYLHLGCKTFFNARSQLTIRKN